MLARSAGPSGRPGGGPRLRTTNPNLGLSLGVGDSETERLLTLRDQVDEGEAEHAPTWDDILDRYGADAPDGVRLSVITRIENPEPG